MKPFYEKLSKTIVNTQYFSRWTVLVIDSLIATFATLCVFVSLSLMGHDLVSSKMIVYVVLTSLFVSVGTFYAFGTYRGIMRHTTIQEIMRLSLAAIVKSIILLGIFVFLKNMI